MTAAAAVSAHVEAERTKYQALSFWLFVGVTILSSIYALMAYMPVTYFKLIRTPMFPALPVAFKFQSGIFTAAAIFLAWSWNRRLRKSPAKIACFSFIAAVCGWLLFRNPYAHLEDNGLAAALIVGALLPLLAFLVAAVGRAQYECFITLISEVSFIRVLRLAVVVSGIHFLTIFLFTWRMSGDLTVLGLWPAGAVSMLCQIGLALTGTAILKGTAMAEQRIRLRAPLLVLAVSGMFAFVFFSSLLAPLPFTIRLGKLYAGVMGIGVALILVLWMGTPQGGTSRSRKRLSTPAAVLLIGLFILFYPIALSSDDWNMLLQRICCLVSLCLLAKALPVGDPDGSSARNRRHSVAVVALLAGAVVCGSIWLVLSAPSSQFAGTLRRYSRLDSSFRLVRDVLPVTDQDECDEFCAYLYANANVESPMEVPTVDVVKAGQGAKPFNIFVIVVDNLRRDGISPYSPDIDFTPQLQAFAADSTVFRNSYTRYDGTALSELALWSGTSQIHKQFPQPFSRVNTLNKLANGYGYRKYVTWDDILPLVLQDDEASFIKLDSHAASWRQLDFCNTWREFIHSHDETLSKNPVLFYSQPKNVHNVVLAMQETPKVARSYGKREVKISAAIERLDGCFGDFIEALRSRGMYDESLIVVTSDHGSDEEAGFKGHGLFVRPDDVRVPLIIHLPGSLKGRFVTDTSQVTFVSDIAPTIAELLGAKMIAPAQFAGRPLFTHTLAEQSAASRPYYLVESSYFPVFGTLADNGTKLYVDNAQRRSRVFYDLSVDPGAHHSLLTKDIQEREQARIRKELEGFNNWYKVLPPRVSFLEWWLH